MTPNRFFVPGLDGLRFISFLLIFIHHLEEAHVPFLDFIKEHGWIGVDLFFSLSAFLLTRLLIEELHHTGGLNFRKYFMRRILRIWPLFFTYLSAVILLSVYREGISGSGFRIISLFTFTDNFLTAIQGFNPIPFTGHLWTIAYEEQFYLLLPAAVLLLYNMSGSQKVKLFVSITIAGCVIRLLFIFYHVKHPAIWVLPFTHFESILAGMLFGSLDFVSLEKSRMPIMIATVFAGFLILFLPGTGVISYHLMILYPCVGIFTGGIVFAVITFKNKAITNIIASPVMSYLGKISYGLYVFHQICLEATGYALRQFSIDIFLLNATVALLITVLVSLLSYQILETPFLKLKKKFTIISSR